jgi:hypothetical protein
MLPILIKGPQIILLLAGLVMAANPITQIQLPPENKNLEVVEMEKVYSENLGREFNLNELENNGTVEHEGETLYLIQQAYVENHGSGVAYFANAVDKTGKAYSVQWDTTPDWDLAQELAKIEARQEYEELDVEDQARLSELKAMDLPDPYDEGEACDWDNPVSIKELD